MHVHEKSLDYLSFLWYNSYSIIESVWNGNI